MDAFDFQKIIPGDKVKLDFLELTADERRIYIQQAAIQRNVSPIIIEKDFWVC